MREMVDPPPRRGPAYKTKLCALWQRSHHCPRGASCGFAHGGAELRTPPPHSSFPPRPGPPGFGRRDHRTHDFRGRPERRNSPRGRYSPERDTRGHLFRGQNRRPSSRDRGSSHSRSPINKSERRHKKKVDGEKTDSSGSFSTSDSEDRKKDDRQSSGDEKDHSEAQLKQIALDLKLKALREDKSKLQTTLDKKIDETGILSTRVDDLEAQLNKEKQNCERMISKIKKLIKAHGRYMKAQEDLKRSKGRFERLADLLASDSLKSGTKEQGSSVNAGNDDPHSAYEMSADDQGQKHGSKARKRSTALSTSEEEKSGKKRRVIGDDVIHMSGKYRPEDALESFNVKKGTDSPKVLSLKKLREGDNNDEGIVVSSRNDFTDRYNGNEEDPVD